MKMRTEQQILLRLEQLKKEYSYRFKNVGSSEQKKDEKLYDDYHQRELFQNIEERDLWGNIIALSWVLSIPEPNYNDIPVVSTAG
jgi:hypothetical protein